MTDIERVGVVGGGLMGSGIAEVMARAAKDVVVVESSPTAVDAAHGRLEASLKKAEARGKIDSAADVLARIASIPQGQLEQLLPWNWRRAEGMLSMAA